MNTPTETQNHNWLTDEDRRKGAEIVDKALNMPEPTNASRRNAALKALEAHAVAKGEHFNPTFGIEDCLTNLLADLRHLSHANEGSDFDDCVEISVEHFIDELRSEQLAGQVKS